VDISVDDRGRAGFLRAGTCARADAIDVDGETQSSNASREPEHTARRRHTGTSS
jgi:hypothetical protein